ncbi:MAG: response regulator [Clostridiales bacterium]|nr:response regulator [Candidatus Crickella equi]
MIILLVDDEIPALNELESAVTEAIGEENIYSFSKASEAMAFAEEKKIDIAFLDINMRFMDGITMAKKLVEFYPKCNIIFCTGYSEYALDALDTYCSGYLLKPISTEKVKTALEHLRYPTERQKKRVELRCFGNFDVLVDGVPVAFKYKKSRELLAYLTDRAGAEATTQEIIAAIFEENKTSYFSNIRLDLINTLTALDCVDIVETAYGRMRINRDKVDCDYFDYLDGNTSLFHGEYMSQYSFAETTCALLNE